MRKFKLMTILMITMTLLFQGSLVRMQLVLLKV